MMKHASRAKPEKLSLSLRRITQQLHEVSEARFATLCGLAPDKVAHHLTTLTQMLLAWHDAGSGMRGTGKLPRVLARAMAEHEAVIAPSGAGSRPALPPALSRFSLGSRGEAIGAAYTLCGSALGLRTALTQADLTAASEQRMAADLMQAGIAMERRWRSIRRAIDLWGLEHPDLQADALAGAATAFCVALTILDAMIEHHTEARLQHD